MRPLVAVRRAAPFDPSFVAKDDHHWPIARAARFLSAYSDFPPVEALGAVFAGCDAPVRFVPAPPHRRRGEALDPGALYDARIAVDREVPTRARCWHDLMNALVWGAFPRAKLALHRRQHAAIRARVGAGAHRAHRAYRLPPTRTPELDALALLDEGGVLVLDGSAPAGSAIIFGHAIHESLALGVVPSVVAAVNLAPPAPSADLLDAVDRAFASWLGDAARAALHPKQLRRVRIVAGRAWTAPGDGDAGRSGMAGPVVLS